MWTLHCVSVVLFNVVSLFGEASLPIGARDGEAFLFAGATTSSPPHISFRVYVTTRLYRF